MHSNAPPRPLLWLCGPASEFCAAFWAEDGIIAGEDTDCDAATQGKKANSCYRHERDMIGHAI